MFCLVGDEACLEVTLEWALGSDPCSGEIRRSDEGFAAVDDNCFGVNAGAEDSLEEVAPDEGGVFIKVLPEAGSGFFGVEETDGDTLMNEV